MIFKIILFPILFFLIPNIISLLIENIKRENRRSRVSRREVELSLAQKMARIRNFAIKKSHKKQKSLVILIVGVLLSSVIGLYKWPLAILYVLIAPFIVNSILKATVGAEMEAFDTLIGRYLEFKKSKMGLLDNEANIYNYETEFKILENDEEDGEPSKLVVYIPATFDPSFRNNFIDSFSDQFGRGRPFEIDMTNEDFNGWDTTKGGVVIKLEEPLPSKAPWDAWYIEHPDIQWSFFPLGLSTRGGVPLVNPKTGREERVVGISLDNEQRKYGDKKGLALGEEISSSPQSLIAGATGGGKSVGQNVIMAGCLARPDKWLLLGVDLKRVELSRYRKFGVEVATEMEDARDLIVGFQAEMMRRYTKMESMGVTNWSDVPNRTENEKRAILMIVDEMAELLAKVTGGDEETKAIQECQDQIRCALASIARLGRAAHCFFVGAAQRPDSDTIPMQIRNNMSNRIVYGPVDPGIGTMMFGNKGGEVTRIPGNPKGRAALRVHSSPVIHFQGFFAPDDWIENYRKSKGLPIKIYDNAKKETEEKKDIQNEMSQAEFDAVNSAVENLLKQAE